MHDVTNSLDDLWNCLSSGRREIARAWMCRKNTSSHVESIARSATFSEETQRSSQRSTHGHARMCSWVLHLGTKVANHGRCHGLPGSVKRKRIDCLRAGFVGLGEHFNFRSAGHRPGDNHREAIVHVFKKCLASR